MLTRSGRGGSGWLAQRGTGAESSCVLTPDLVTDQNDDDRLECQEQGDPDCIGNPALVAGCRAPERRLLRLVSPADAEGRLPADNSTVFVACQGRAFPAE